MPEDKRFARFYSLIPHAVEMGQTTHCGIPESHPQLPTFLVLLVVALDVPCSGLLCSLQHHQGSIVHKELGKMRLSFALNVVNKATTGENRVV